VLSEKFIAVTAIKMRVVVEIFTEHIVNKLSYSMLMLNTVTGLLF